MDPRIQKHFCAIRRQSQCELRKLLHDQLHIFKEISEPVKSKEGAHFIRIGPPARIDLFIYFVNIVWRTENYGDIVFELLNMINNLRKHPQQLFWAPSNFLILNLQLLSKLFPHIDATPQPAFFPHTLPWRKSRLYHFKSNSSEKIEKSTYLTRRSDTTDSFRSRNEVNMLHTLNFLNSMIFRNDFLAYLKAAQEATRRDFLQLQLLICSVELVALPKIDFIGFWQKAKIQIQKVLKLVARLFWQKITSLGCAFLHSTILPLISWKWISHTLSDTSSLSNVMKPKPKIFL